MIEGVIDVASTASDSGTYTGVDPTGPIWSLAPGTDRLHKDVGVIYFDLVVDGERRAAARLARIVVPPQTRTVPVRDSGLVGTLFVAPGHHPRPAVIVLGGSEGGLQSAEERAAPFAAHGYAALALAYFRSEGLPPELVRIPLEYFERAIAWIGTQPELDAGRVAVVGVSRGAEAALLVATRSPLVQAVVAYGPSSLVWGGLDRTNPDSHVPAWTADGVALESGVGRRLLDTPDSVARYGIPVERMRCTVLLIAGEDDRVWPSATMANQVMARLCAHGRAQNSAALIYPEAGHGIAFPIIPVAARLSLGGTPSGLAQADRESWRAVLGLLDRAMPRN